VKKFGFKITPWEVKGKIDYERLIKEFGVQRITKDIIEKIKELVGEVHPLIYRGIFFAHRDFDRILEEYEKGKKFFLYTGRAPGKSSMHIAHLIPFLLCKWLQEKFEANFYIEIPDEEKFLAKKVDSIEELRENVKKDILHLSALGLDPDRTFIFKTTEFISKLYRPAVLIARHITYSMARATFGFTGETSIGLIFYPALQIAPTFFERNRCLIPCGIDQDPYFRLQRDIAPKLGYPKTAELLNKLIWGLEGPGSKMSASKPETAIFLEGDPEREARKIFEAFTGGGGSLKEHREKGGRPEVCSVFYYYSILFEPDEEKLRERYNRCRSGELICGDCKQELFERIKKFLENHQRKLKSAEKMKEKYMYDGKLAKRMWEWEFSL